MLQQITDLPKVPEPRLVDSLLQIFSRVCEDLRGGSVAVLLSRPGGPGITAAERIWAQRLTDAANTARVRFWPVHLANDHELLTVTPDYLAAPHAAAG